MYYATNHTMQASDIVLYEGSHKGNNELSYIMINTLALTSFFLNLFK